MTDLEDLSASNTIPTLGSAKKSATSGRPISFKGVATPGTSMITWTSNMLFIICTFFILCREVFARKE